MVSSCDPHPTEYDDNSDVIESVQFDYQEIDRRVFGIVYNGEDGTPNPSRDSAATLKLLDWIWQSGPKNLEGLTIRSTIVAWVFLPHLHPLTLTQIAAMINKDKQSIGRWVDQFKIDFPHVRTEHMKR